MRSALCAASRVFLIVLLFYPATLLSPVLCSSAPASNDDHLPSLNILSPSQDSILWSDLVIELELILPMSVAVAPDIEVCLDLRSSAQLQMHQCFPVTLDTSNANQLRSPLKTAVTLEIEDSSLFQVEAYIKGCATKNQHCRSSVQVKTCRTSIFGVIGGGAACKSSWNSQNGHFAAPLVDSSSLSSRQHATSSSYTSCMHMDSINRCVFPSGALCFDEQSHQWHVKRNSL